MMFYEVDYDFSNSNEVLNYYTISTKVIDMNGQPMEGININIRDKNGNIVDWLENMMSLSISMNCLPISHHNAWI
jgi:hypothetical protein